MAEISLLRDLIIVLAAATVVGIIASRLGQPAMVGYLFCGLIIGPNALGLIRNMGAVERLADIGVVLLMFGVGASLSLERMRSVHRVAVLGGIVQLGLTILLGLLVGTVLKWNALASVYVGAMIASSSTMTAIKTLVDRSELDSIHGRVTMGIAVVQDMGILLLFAILPSMAGLDGEPWVSVLLPVLRGVIFLVAAVYAANTVIPFILKQVAALDSRELFMLTLVVLSVGAAVGAAALGFSLSLGAFIAGLVISQSVFRHETISRIIPVRDVFVALFFVTVGMLIDPRFVLRHPLPVLLLVMVAVIGKFVICSGITLTYGYSGVTALLVGILLAQAGEFAFVMGQFAVRNGLIDRYYFSAVMSATLISLAITPLLYQNGRRIQESLADIPILNRIFRFPRREEVGEEINSLCNHAILCGYGRVGRSVGVALSDFSLPFVVVDYDIRTVERLREQGIPAIYGDAGSETVVRELRPECATMAVVALPDAISTRLAVRSLHRANPNLGILARTSEEQTIGELLEEGASEVFLIEFEAGLEIMRHTLAHLGAPPKKLHAYLENIRRVRYREMGEDVDEMWP